MPEVFVMQPEVQHDATGLAQLYPYQFKQDDPST